MTETAKPGRPGRKLDTAGRARVAAILDAPGGRSLSHSEVARRAGMSPTFVQRFRVERGDVKPTCPLRPEHAALLGRLFRAHAMGSDMRVRAILGSPDGQALRALVETLGASSRGGES